MFLNSFIDSLLVYFTFIITLSIQLLICFDLSEEAIDLNRRTRNVFSEPIYFFENEEIELHCFSNLNNNENIISYEWKFSDGNVYSDEDIDNNPSSFRKGAHKGDVLFSNLNLKSVEAGCEAFVDGYLKKGNRYLLIPGNQPSWPLILSEGVALDVELPAEEGSRLLECRSDGGVPPPYLTFLLNGEILIHNKGASIKHKVHLDRNLNGKMLFCKVNHTSVQYQREVTLNIMFAPFATVKLREVKAEAGKPFNLTFTFRANPFPGVFGWSYSEDCNDPKGLTHFEARYRFSIPKLMEYSVDEYYATISLVDVSERDFKRCFFLRVTNVKGSAVFRQTLNSMITSDTGASVMQGRGMVTIILTLVIGTLLMVTVGTLLRRHYRHSKIEYPLPDGLEEVSMKMKDGL